MQEAPRQSAIRYHSIHARLRLKGVDAAARIRIRIGDPHDPSQCQKQQSVQTAFDGLVA